MTEELEQLERLLDTLDRGVNRTGRGDAIAEVLADPPRSTRAQSLSDHETVQRFRKELVDGMIRADTANKLLSLVQKLVEAALV